MPASTKAYLARIDNLGDMQSFCSMLTAKDVAWSGGRKFKYNSDYYEGELSLNDIVAKFAQLKAAVPENEDLALQIRNEIHRLDEASDSLLKSKNFLTRFFTAIRSVDWAIISPSTRHNALNEIGNQISTPIKKAQFFTEEIIDDVCHNHEVPRRLTENMKETLRKSLKNEFHTDRAIADLKQQILALEALDGRNSQFFQEFIYKTRQSQNEHVRSQIAPLIVAALAAAHGTYGPPWNATDLTSPMHPIQSVSFHLGGGAADWKIGEDPILLQNAQILYREYLDRNP